MDWSKFKLGVGPISSQVIDSCLKYSYEHNYPLMIIASRNQVDYDTGYVFKTNELVKHIKSNEHYDSDRIKICRDHCGPNFADKDKLLSLDEAVSICKQTIKTDIENGFDLIHIDVSRTETKKQLEVAKILIEYAISLNPSIHFEFGSEDNTGQNLDDTLTTLDLQLEFVKQYNRNIVFLVNQTGSLTKHTQVGKLNVDLCKKISDKIHGSGFLFKEHNADYILKEETSKRKHVGVDAVNIAPQLGYIHSYVLDRLGYNFEQELNEFKKYVLDQGYWKKWVVSDSETDHLKFLVSAHYCFNSSQADKIYNKIKDNKIQFQELLHQELSIAIDQYRLGLAP